MKTKRILTLLFVGLLTIMLFAGKKTITFNVMVADKAKKVVMKKIKKQKGVYSVKTDKKMGSVIVEYNDKKTNINTIAGVFESSGVYASPVGQNCANKPGGCLNNKPTTNNTMR